MKKTLKTALASTLAVCLTCSTLAFGSSAAAPDRTAADTDTAYARFTREKNTSLSTATGIKILEEGMVLSFDAKLSKAETSTLNFQTKFTLDDKELKVGLYRDSELMLKAGSKEYKFGPATIGGKLGKAFSFNEWHSYKMELISNGTNVTGIELKVDGVSLLSDEQVQEILSNFSDYVYGYSEVKCAMSAGDVCCIDNYTISGEALYVNENFEEGKGIFNNSVEVVKVGNGIMGDLDQSGSVDILDLVKLKKLSVSTEQVVITEGTNALADVEDDSVINAQDVVALRKILISM